MSILYFSYDTIKNPIVKSQVLPILKELQKNQKTYLLSFENTNIKRINKKHYILRYNNSTLSKIFIFLYSIFFSIRLCKKKKIKIVITRSYVPQIISLFVKYFTNIKIIFDIRGYWFDEKNDFKSINFLVYKLLKIIEKFLYRKADRVITLSDLSKIYISRKFGIDIKNIKSVTTFADIKKIKFIKKTKSNVLRLAYIGSLTNSYDFLTTTKFLKRLNELTKKWNMTIFNIGEEDYFTNLISNYPELKSKIIYTNFLNKNKISFILKNFDVGLYFIHPTFSKTASCPTKLGEFLASGTPVITNPKIGDINNIIKNNKCGLIIDKKSIKNLQIKKILDLKNKKFHHNSRKTALKFFNFKKEFIKYKNLIDDLSF